MCEVMWGGIGAGKSSALDSILSELQVTSVERQRMVRIGKPTYYHQTNHGLSQSELHFRGVPESDVMLWLQALTIWSKAFLSIGKQLTQVARRRRRLT